MARIALTPIFLGLLFLLAGCAAEATTDGEPSAPIQDSTPATQQVDTPEATEALIFEPATPVVVDMGEAGGAAQAEEDEEMEGGGEGQEMPVPGVRQPGVQMAEQARQALAERLDVPVEDVTVESSEEVTWPDASLGCPNPDMMYAQVLTPGFRIVLVAGGESYTYHGDATGQLVLCGPDGQPVS
jgi:hypothetical protein